MPILLQHILAIALAVACLVVVVIGAVRTLRSRKSGVGNCCATGCSTHSTDAARKTTPRRESAPTQFIPLDAIAARTKARR